MVGLHYCARVGYSAVFKQLTLMYAPQLKQLELPNPNITKNSFLTNVPVSYTHLTLPTILRV